MNLKKKVWSQYCCHYFLSPNELLSVSAWFSFQFNLHGPKVTINWEYGDKILNLYSLLHNFPKGHPHWTIGKGKKKACSFPLRWEKLYTSSIIKGQLVQEAMVGSSQLSLNSKYRISSNNSRGRLFLSSHQKGAIIRGKAIIQGRRLFQIFLTEGRALNILFYNLYH